MAKGWLDNYNDSQVSLPEGFVGEGIFNGPKFDNPAWGGQFQNGGTKKPITTREDFDPSVLSNIPGLTSLASGNQPGYNRQEQYGPLGDLYRYYGGQPLEHDVLVESQNKPSTSKDKNAKYISLNHDREFVNEVLDNYERVSSGKLDKGIESKLNDNSWSVSGYSSAGKDAHKTKKQGSEHHSNAIGRYTLGKGKDKKGEYISYYDKFDQGTGDSLNPGEALGLTKPFEIYDRIYLKDVNRKYQMGGDVYPVNYVPQAQQGKQIFTKGLEDHVNDFLGHPQDGAFYMSESIPGEAPVDSIRHSFAGRYTQDAISKKLGNGVIGNVAGVIGSNLMGAAHELGTMFKDKRDWPTKLRESGEDMVNNAIGSVVGAIPYMDSKAKDKMMLKMAYGNLLPDGYVATPEGMKQGLSDNIYFKNQKGEVKRKYQMGGNLPGAVGNMYARTGSPSKGPRRNQTDVTDASAQNGKEMQYYQNGLDWKPKTISKNGAWLDNYKEEIIKDDRGQWDHPGEITEIGSNEITMEGVPYDVLGVSDTGDTKLMKPGKNYKFKGKKVTEYPMAKNGVNQQDQKTLQQLDQLTNFTNYNTKQPGGWLDTL